MLQPVFSNFSAFSPSLLLIAMPAGVALVSFAAWVMSGGRALRMRRVPAWRSATAGVAGPDHYSAFGYANVLRHVLANVLGTKQSAVVVEVDGEAVPSEAHMEVRSVVVEPVEAYLYRPARAALLRLVHHAKRLQSGRFDAYVGYMLFALIVVLAVVALSK